MNEGQELGQWTIGTLISDSGGNGDVWAATNEAGHNTAIKILRKFSNEAKNEKRRKRFENEIKTMKHIQELDIPRVMRLLDHGFTKDDQPWFAMPLAKTIDLNGVETVLKAMIDVTDTIAQLHERGLTHRDIKPSNLLELNGEITVSDFGLARMVGDEHFTKTGELTGSVGYTAAECIGRSDEPRFGCDVYALAKTTWVLLTGDAPPHGELRTPDDDLTGYSVVFDTVPKIDQLQSLIFAASARDPDKRPTARQLCDGFRLGLKPVDESTKTSKASPANRARTLFGDSAANNERDRESAKLFTDLARDCSRQWNESWRETIESLGWQAQAENGGNMGHHTSQLDAGWQANWRWFFSGAIYGQLLEVALTFRQKKVFGAARLVFGVTLAIQHQHDMHVTAISEEKAEHKIASREFDTFVTGPQLEDVRKQLMDIVSCHENQFRTIEQLKKIVSSR